jgi:hypothetical protein
MSEREAPEWCQLKRGWSRGYPNPELLSSWSKVMAVLLEVIPRKKDYEPPVSRLVALWAPCKAPPGFSIWCMQNVAAVDKLRHTSPTPDSGLGRAGARPSSAEEALHLAKLVRDEA